MQMFEVATDAGADDIVPANDEGDHLEGYKVTLAYSLCFVHLCRLCSLTYTGPTAMLAVSVSCHGAAQGLFLFVSGTVLSAPHCAAQDCFIEPASCYNLFDTSLPGSSSSLTAIYSESVAF